MRKMNRILCCDQLKNSCGACKLEITTMHLSKRGNETILRFTINVCNNQSNSLHVQNEKETNNEAGNEHTPTTMLHDLVFNHRLKKHSYPQLKTKSLIPC